MNIYRCVITYGYIAIATRTKKHAACAKTLVDWHMRGVNVRAHVQYTCSVTCVSETILTMIVILQSYFIALDPVE